MDFTNQTIYICGQIRINKPIIYNIIMTENRTSKMNLEQERKIAELQERVNRLENLCYAAKEVVELGGSGETFSV